MLLSLGLPADAAHRHEASSISSCSRAILRPASTVCAMAAGMETLHRRLTDGPRSSLFSVSQTPDLPSDGDEDAPSEAEGSHDHTDVRPGSPATLTVKPAGRRPKTSFLLAHPAPSFINRQRLRIRPRLLLQLQRISASARPLPALDVLPSTILPPRLARRFPTFFRGKDGLGPDDLVVVSSEEHQSPAPVDPDHADESDEDLSESRHVMATICRRRKEEGGLHGQVEICLSDGLLWQARPLTTGGYEFSALGDDGRRTTARWVPRLSSLRHPSNPAQARSNSAPGREERRFSFSLINPNFRRHPIIASMTRTTIDVFDVYPASAPSTMMHSPLPTPQLSSPQTPVAVYPSPSPSFDPSFDRSLKQTDDELRTLILVTGIWVALREGWSESFRYQDAMAPRAQPTSAAATSPWISHGLTLSPTRGTTKPLPVNSKAPPNRQSVDAQTPRNSPAFLPLPPPFDPRPEFYGNQAMSPRRAHSTGTAIRQRVVNRHHSTGYRSLPAGPAMIPSNAEDTTLEVARVRPLPDGRDASHGVSVRRLISGSTHRRVRSLSLHTANAPGYQHELDTEVKVTGKRRWTRLKSLLGLVKKGPGER